MPSYVITRTEPYAGRYLIVAAGRVIESSDSKRHAIRVAQQSADFYHAHRCPHTRTVLENCGDVLRVVYRSRYARRHRSKHHA